MVPCCRVATMRGRKDQRRSNALHSYTRASLTHLPYLSLADIWDQNNECQPAHSTHGDDELCLYMFMYWREIFSFLFINNFIINVRFTSHVQLTKHLHTWHLIIENKNYIISSICNYCTSIDHGTNHRKTLLSSPLLGVSILIRPLMLRPPKSPGYNEKWHISALRTGSHAMPKGNIRVSIPLSTLFPPYRLAYSIRPENMRMK